MSRLPVTLLIIAVCTLFAVAGEPVHGFTHDQALTTLMQGNQRFVGDQPLAWSATAAKRTELTAGQHPFACVITCSDSRVPPELLFDQSLGDIFVVRLAGNVMTPEAVGSVEYAVEHLHVPLVVVLGHSKCGAVSAALNPPAERSAVSTILDLLNPAVAAARAQGYDGPELADAVIRGNAQRGALTLIDGSRALESELRSGDLTLISAVYDLSTGRVDWLTQLSAPPALSPVAAAPMPAPEAKPASATFDGHAAVEPAEKSTEPAAGASRYKIKTVEPSAEANRHRP
jgi:carbonic anhydrase